MLFAQDFCYLVDSLVGVFLINGAGKQPLKMIGGQYSLHHRCVWGKHYVVLIHTHRVGSFGSKCANYLHRNLVEPHYTAYGVAAVGKQIVYYCLAKEAYFGS